MIIGRIGGCGMHRIGRDAELQRDLSIMFDHLEPGEPNDFFFSPKTAGSE
jgi:hypothetical protein